MVPIGDNTGLQEGLQCASLKMTPICGNQLLIRFSDTGKTPEDLNTTLEDP